MKKLLTKIFLGISISLLFSSCQEKAPKSDEVLLDENVLYHSELGWKMEIPEGWINISKKEMEQKREKLKGQFSHISTNLNAPDPFGISLQKDRFNTFNSIYFLNENNSYKKNDFQKDKIEKYRIINEYGSAIGIDSTLTKSLRIGNKQFDYYTFTSKFKDEETLKMTIFTGKINQKYQLIVTIKTDDEISESEILDSFYNSTFD